MWLMKHIHVTEKQKIIMLIKKELLRLQNTMKEIENDNNFTKINCYI